MAQLRTHGDSAFTEHRQRLVRAFDQPGRMGKASVLGVDPLPFVRSESEFVQFAELPGKQFTLMYGRGRILFGRASLRHALLPSAKKRGDFGREHRRARVRIGERELRILCEPRVLRLLTVDVGEPVACFTQLRLRHRYAGDPRARAPAGLDHPPQDRRSVVGRQVLAGQPVGERTGGR